MRGINIAMGVAALGLGLAGCGSADFTGKTPAAKGSPVAPAPVVPEAPVETPPNADATAVLPTPTPSPSPKHPLPVVPPVKSAPLPPACAPQAQGMTGKIYKLPVNTKALPDFSKLTPLGVVEATELDVPSRDFSQGFPGAPDLVVWFGIDFYGTLDVPEDGAYKFRLNSDDGAQLYIDDKLVVDDDGVHPATIKDSVAITLTKGPHPLHLPWYQGPPTTIALQLFWMLPKTTAFEIIPASALTTVTNCTLPVVGQFP